jgi:hypothetical protein
MGDRHDRRGSRSLMLTVAVLAALRLTGCSTSDPPPADSGATTGRLGCDGSAAAPVPLDGPSGGGTVVDVVARPTGQLVAVGTSVWIRDPTSATWRGTAKPGGPNDVVTAGAERGGEVWVATDDGADLGEPSRLFRSSDLETWSVAPVMVDGAPSTAPLQALTHDGTRWLALAQSDAEFSLLSSRDGQDWTTDATLPIRTDAGTARALFDLAPLDQGPTSVGFDVGGSALRPLEVVWSRDGTTSLHAADGEQLEGVRPWALAPLTDGRTVVAADQIHLGPDEEPTGFTALLYERSGTGGLELLAELPAPAAFAAPSDLVATADGDVVVVGAVGETRDALSPVAWTVCLRPQHD